MHNEAPKRKREVVPCQVCGVEVVKQATQFDLCGEHRKIKCVDCGVERRMRSGPPKNRCSPCQAKRKKLARNWGVA